MREISPSTTHSCEEFLSFSGPDARLIAHRIREQKENNCRPKPSQKIVDSSQILTIDLRHSLIDKVASLVDENFFGRSEMCEQFATLTTMALGELGIYASFVEGQCTYFKNGNPVFEWRHCWVRIGREVIDANTDVLSENPAIPKGISVHPYWGDIQETPKDRRLRGRALARAPIDGDIEKYWWPDLRAWIAGRVTL